MRWSCKTLRYGISIGLTALSLAGCDDDLRWDDWQTSALSISANGTERTDQPVTIAGTFPDPLHVVEIGASGEPVDADVPFQVDSANELTFLMMGTTPAEGRRFYRIYPGPATTSKITPLISASDNSDYRGQESITIRTAAATFHYHKRGGGFASLVDENGLDWISYNPGPGPAGQYRGLPNLIYPEGGLHPGQETCDSRLLAAGPLRVHIVSTCHDGAWRVAWDIYPSFARMTVEKAGHPYWFLYEGTPGGELNLGSGYWAQSDGTRKTVRDDWQGRVASPRWVYFGDNRLNRVFYLVHHEDDGTFDQFWQMEGAMTVFGFGRQFRCCAQSLNRTPARFTIGFASSADHGTVRRVIEGAYRDLKIEKVDTRS